MAQSTILAATTSAGDSSEVTVGATPVMVSLFSDEEDFSFGRVKAQIFMEVGDGLMFPFVDGDVSGRGYSGCYLFNTQRSYVLKGPGVYIVRKSPTDKSIGVVADEVTAP